MNMKNVLVTGGAGFIGSNFIKMMIDDFDEYFIINLDSLTYAGNLENLKNIDKNKYKFYHGSINDSALVETIFNEFRIDKIINFAAESHVDRSIKNPNIFVETNVLGTANLLNIARKYIDNGIKFVQVSTDEVYGSLPEDKPEEKFTEQTPLNPHSPYSASKAAADLLVQSYHDTYGLDTAITRCSNNYGPYQFPEKLIPLMINNAINDKSLPVYGDGKNIRDWLHVSDHCLAVKIVAEQSKAGEVYNIGGNNEMKNIDIVKLIISALNKSESLIKYVPDRLGHDRRYAIDSSKIQNELNWQPKVSFEQGINDTIKWYLNNSSWLNNIISGDYLKYYSEMYGE